MKYRAIKKMRFIKQDWADRHHRKCAELERRGHAVLYLNDRRWVEKFAKELEEEEKDPSNLVPYIHSEWLRMFHLNSRNKYKFRKQVVEYIQALKKMNPIINI